MRLILTHFTSNLCEFQHVIRVTVFFFLKKHISLKNENFTHMTCWNSPKVIVKWLVATCYVHVTCSTFCFLWIIRCLNNAKLLKKIKINSISISVSILLLTREIYLSWVTEILKSFCRESDKNILTQFAGLSCYSPLPNNSPAPLINFLDFLSPPPPIRPPFLFGPPRAY